MGAPGRAHIMPLKHRLATRRQANRVNFGKRCATYVPRGRFSMETMACDPLTKGDVILALAPMLAQYTAALAILKERNRARG